MEIKMKQGNKSIFISKLIKIKQDTENVFL